MPKETIFHVLVWKRDRCDNQQPANKKFQVQLWRPPDKRKKVEKASMICVRRSCPSFFLFCSPCLAAKLKESVIFVSYFRRFKRPTRDAALLPPTPKYRVVDQICWQVQLYAAQGAGSNCTEKWDTKLFAFHSNFVGNFFFLWSGGEWCEKERWITWWSTMRLQGIDFRINNHQ